MKESPTSWWEEAYVEEPGETYSPLWRLGIRWVGKLNRAAQVWRKDAESGRVVDGDRIMSAT